MTRLFEQVVVATGISKLFANHAVARACERAGVNPDKLSPATLKIALPEIEKTVRTFCNADLHKIMTDLHVLARQ